MNKFSLLTCVASLPLILASCNNGDDFKYTNTVNIPSYNLITSSSGTEEPFVGTATYGITVEYPIGTIVLNTSNLQLPKGVTGNFTTVPMNLVAKDFVIDGEQKESIYFTSPDPTNKGTAITNLNAYVTQAVYWPVALPDGSQVPGYTWTVPTQTQHFAFMQYNYGSDYYVRSFWPDLNYRGQTITTYPGADTPYTTDGIQYRVVMQRKDGALTGKADMIFYNAKFSPMTPDLCVVVKDLDVEFTNDGYTLSTTDNVPYMVEAGELQPVDRFTFNDIKASVSGDLTGISINYTVASVFKGTFSGSCMVKQ